MRGVTILTTALLCGPLMAAVKLILPAGTEDEPSAVAPITPCDEPIAFWWDETAFHAGKQAFAWKDIGVEPADGVKFRVRYVTGGPADMDIDCMIDLSRPRFEIGSFGVIGNQAITNRIRILPSKDGNMRSYFVAQGQTPDFLNLSKGLPVRKGVPYEFEITGPGPSSGDTWYHLYDTDGARIYFSGTEFHDPKLLFDFQYIWTKPEKKLMYVVTRNWTEGLPGNYTLRITAKDLQSNTLGSWTRSQRMRKVWGLDEYAFDVADLPPGFYWMNVEYLDADGKTVHADKARYMRPTETMPWDGTTLGAEDTVPPPWPAPEFAADGTFRCWNRVIRFGGAGLVSSIVNGGREQLAAPAAVILDGRELSFDVALKEKKTSSATYRLTARGADIAVDAVCDFDGYVRFSLEYGGGVKSLAWRTALRRDQVFSFNKSGTAADTAVLGKDGTLDLAYDANAHPWLWAGDAVVGLLFGIVDLHGTHVKDLATSARAVTSAEAFTVTQNLVDTPYTGDQRRTVAFYLEPTPVKPKNLDLAAVPSDRIVGWTGHLCDYFEIKYPGFEDPHLFKKFIDMVKQGKRVFFYNGTSGTSPESPFWGWYRRDWVRGGDPSYYAHEAPIWKDQEWKRRIGNWTYGCLNSKSFFESKLWGVNWYLHVAPEIKDLYFDLANPNFGGCMSPYHPCRWTDDFGRTMAGKNLDATREFHKRVYRLVKAKNADGALFGHTTDTRTPSDVFFDMLTMGESLASRVRWQDSYYDIYTPELMQSMFAPRAADTIVRTPPQFLRWRECWDPVGYANYNPHEPKLERAIRHCIAYIKIHDVVIPRAPHDREGPQFAAVEYPISRLGVDRKYWCYYTPGEVPVALSAPGSRQLWAYFKNDHRAILIVLNDTDAAVEQAVSVKGLSAKGVELLDKSTYDFTSGACALKLGPRGAKFIAFDLK